MSNPMITKAEVKAAAVAIDQLTGRQTSILIAKAALEAAAKARWQPIETAPPGELWCFWDTCGQQMIAERLNGKWFDWEGYEVSPPSHWCVPSPPAPSQVSNE